eukprot:8262815-Ditylum_brightwellii.AAC.1
MPKTEVTLHMESNSKLEGELQIEHGTLMEVNPITTPMVVFSQNWPSQVHIFEIMGCKDIQGVHPNIKIWSYSKIT